jgi:hypothetical protein
MKKVLFSLVAMLLLSVSGIAQTTFTKITSASDLEAGANYLIVAHYDDLGVLAMGKQNNNNRKAVVVSENGESITVTPGTDPDSDTDVFQFTLGGSTGAWTFFDEAKGGYLYAASSSSNYLKTQTALDANGEWAITFNADGTAEVVAQGENTRNHMRFNPNTQNNAPLFGAYSESSTVGALVSFYKAGGAELDPEPSNYPTNFTATPEGVEVVVTWTDATGGQLPAGYLVRASIGNVDVPVDGTVYNNANDKYVPQGNQTITFTGLQGGTTYHFAIFPYTNSGANIDYKTDGNYPTVTVTTENIYYLLDEEFDEDLGSFFAYDAYGDQYWHQATYQGTTYVQMNGYADGAPHQNEDWLIGYVEISPNMVFNEVWLEFKTAMKYEGDPLSVAISSDYDGNSDPSDFDWVYITSSFNYSTGNYEWVESGKVDIAPMVPNYPSSFYVAFIYISSDELAASWEVDGVKVTGMNVNAVNEVEKSSISLYPNPASEQVSFMLDADAEVSIFDVTGRMVSVSECKAGQAQLNVSELESGVYFVNFRFANGATAVSKFVKF